VSLPDAHALVVGIASYRLVPQLPPAVINDANDIHSVLTDPAYGGYAAGQTELLLDEQATGAAIRAALAGLAARAGPEATVFVYLSAHGARLGADPGAGDYLLPVDAAWDAGHQSIESAIGGDELTAALRDIGARRLVVVLDTCHAAGLAAIKEGGDALRPGLSDHLYEQLAEGRGRAVLASSRSDESSWILPKASNSLFTKHFLDALRGGAAGSDGFVRIFSVFEYVQPRVTAEQPGQHPVLKADLEENFPIALLQGERREMSPADHDGFRYDAYISYVDREPDATWVWQRIVPRLRAADLRVAVSGDVEELGVARVVSIERGLRQAKRTVVILSPAYLEDHWADFESVLVATLGLQEGSYRLLPVMIADVDPARLPLRISALATLDLTGTRPPARQLDRLMEAVRGPLPRHEPPGGGSSDRS
jgi:hypothetical protein